MQDYIVKSSIASKIVEKATHIDTFTSKNTKAQNLLVILTTTLRIIDSIEAMVEPLPKSVVYCFIFGRVRFGI